MLVTFIKQGALTSKASAYRYRSWELESKESLDFFDSLGIIGNACIKGLTITRIVPNLNSHFDWITDKFRFSFDSLVCSRFIRCIFKREEVSLLDNLKILSDYIWFRGYSSLSIFLGKSLDLLDSLFVKRLASIFKNISYCYDSFLSKSFAILDQRALFYTKLTSFVSYKNLCICGIDLRIEFPVLEAFFYRQLGLSNVLSLGGSSDAINLGNNLLKNISLLLNGNLLLLKSLLLKSFLIFGSISLVNLTNYMRSFFFNISLMYTKSQLKYFSILPYMSDINICELGLFTKTIGGVFLSNSALVFSFDSSDIVFNNNLDFLVTFKSHVHTCAKNEMSFPLVVKQEQNILSVDTQGGLVYSEKLVNKTGMGATVSYYVKTLLNFIKYRFCIIETLSSIKNINVVSYLKLFLINTNFIFVNKISVPNLYVKNINFSFIFNICYSLINVNNISNYFYTHINLVNSPTILLADARLFNKNVTFR